MRATENDIEQNFGHSFCFESYGVSVKIFGNDRGLLKSVEAVIRRTLIDRVVKIDDDGREFDYTLGTGKDAEGNYFRIEFGKSTPGSPSLDGYLSFLQSLVRIRVAEYAKDEVFVHAGVVGWKDRAIIIPAGSFSGKTTLVAEFVKIGAVYYSDEYAVFDSEGYVHPFARDLSMRSEGSWEQTDVPVAELGGSVSDERLPAGLILITKYEPDAEWKPEILTVGEGVVEMVPHTISIRRNTEFALKVLNLAASRAIIARGKRNDARKFAEYILNYLDKL